MEGTSRPVLLSPGLPRLPGGLEPQPPVEAPLTDEEFAPRPPPLPCKPLPPDLAAQIAAGQGMQAALEGWRRHTQLAWCIDKLRREEEEAAAAEAAAAQLQAERPARAPSGPAAHAAASAAVSSNSGSGDEAGMPAHLLHRQLSRASAAPQVKFGDDEMAEADDAAAVGAAAEEEAEGSDYAAAAAAAAAEGAAKEVQLAAMLEQELVAKGSNAVEEADTAAAPAAAAAASPDGGFDAACGWYDLGRSSGEESGSEGEGGGQAGHGPEAEQQRQPTLAQRAIAAALEKIGEPSWEAFCAKLQERQAAAEAAGGGGGRGRGRSRRAGRGKRKAGGDAVQLATVLNKNSSIFHEGFAAAFKEAKEELDKLDTRKQRREKLREFSKLVARWSELTVREHEWYLAHQGQALTGSDAQRFSLLASKVAEEQQQYYQDVQQKAAGGASAARYGHCTARQGAQLEQDAADRRQRQVQRLPQLYRLVAPLPVATAPETAAQAAALREEAPELQHSGTLRLEGQPPAVALPAGPATIDSSLRYLPCTVEGSEAGAAGTAAAAGGSGTAGGGGRGSGPPRVFKKQAVPLLAEDPLLPQLVQQAHQLQAAAASAEANEQQGEECTEQHARLLPTPPAGSADAAASASQPQFCLAASALAALVSTPMLRRGPAWEIPVTILPAEKAAESALPSGGSAGSGGTVVCLEKPLLHRIMSMRAKQQRLQKYAVLSMGVQPPADVVQQATPARRSTCGSAAAAAGPEEGGGEAAVPASAAATRPALPSREAAYDCWWLGDCRLLVRSHGRLQLRQESEQQEQQTAEEAALQSHQQEEQEQQEQQQKEPAVQHVVLGLKTEYLPDPDREEHTMEELCTWWLKLLLRPSAAAVLAAHVHVPHSRLLSAERLTAADLEGLIGGAARMCELAAAGLAMLQGVLRELGRQPPGRYLLTHVPYEEQCCLFRAVPTEVAEYAQGPLPPLPCSPSTAKAGVVYDLHAAHEHSGATDASVIQFVPPRWRPFMPDLPQIPHTFPPRMSLSKMGAKRAARKRQRNLPFAWDVLGKGGDFDQVQHVGQISRADYLAGLHDELA